VGVVTPPILNALCEHFMEKSRLYQSEMIAFLWDEFEIFVTASSLGRALVYMVGRKRQFAEYHKEGMQIYDTLVPNFKKVPA